MRKVCLVSIASCTRSNHGLEQIFVSNNPFSHRPKMTTKVLYLLSYHAVQRHLFIFGESGSGVFPASPYPQCRCSLFLPRERGLTAGRGRANIRLGSSQLASNHGETADSNNVSHKLRFTNGRNVSLKVVFLRFFQNIKMYSFQSKKRSTYRNTQYDMYIIFTIHVLQLKYTCQIFPNTGMRFLSCGYWVYYDFRRRFNLLRKRPEISEDLPKIFEGFSYISLFESQPRDAFHAKSPLSVTQRTMRCVTRSEGLYNVLVSLPGIEFCCFCQPAQRNHELIFRYRFQAV